MTDYWSDFARESEEQITNLNNALLTLERNPGDEAAMDEIFRIAHTLKGNCGAMGLTRASDLAHAIEDLLDAIRRGRVDVDPDIMDVIFEGLDELEAMLEAAGEGGGADAVDRDPTTAIEALRAPVGRESDTESVVPPTEEELDRILARFDPPADSEHDAFLVRLSIAPADVDGVNNGQRVVDALVDAFDLIGTDPSRQAIENDEYGTSFDAIFGSAVGEGSIAAALEPVDAVEAFEIETVTDRLETASETVPEPADADSDSDDDGVEGSSVATGPGDAETPALSADEAQELEVDELLDEFDEFDDLDGLVEDVEDDELDVFDDMGEAGSFDDLFDEDELDGGPGELEPGAPSAAEADAEPTAEPAATTAQSTAPSDEVDDASAVFAELKDEVDMVGFEELQDELEELEFDEFDDDDEVDMDELLGDDVDTDDDSFLELDDEIEVGEEPIPLDGEGAGPADEDGLEEPFEDDDAVADRPTTGGIEAEAENTIEEPATAGGLEAEDDRALEADVESFTASDQRSEPTEDAGLEAEAAIEADDLSEPDALEDLEGGDDFAADFGLESADAVSEREFDGDAETEFDETSFAPETDDGFGNDSASDFETAADDSVAYSEDSITDPDLEEAFPGEAFTTDSASDEFGDPQTDLDADPTVEAAGDSFTAEASEDTPGFGDDDEAEPDDRIYEACPPLPKPTVEVPDHRDGRTDQHGGDDSQSIPVDVDQVDNLLNLVEGLVTARVRLRHTIDEGADPGTISRELDALEDLTSELQETVMDVRLVPLETATSRLPRVVRDISRDQGKEVSLEIEGGSIELDRTILDRIGDPLVHLVRNAVDHGIEPPKEREAGDKPRVGTVRLEADRARDRVQLTISDDGRGLDPDDLREAAIEADVLTPEEAAERSDESLYDLIFHPGLSTASAVTDISGRGVGMDVVKRTIESLDGSVSVHSEPGEGTTVSMELPVTVAIADVLFLEAAGEEFGVPLKVVRDIEDTRRVESTETERVLQTEDGPIPVVDLSTRLQANADSSSTDGDEGMIVRVRDDVRSVALHCDAVHGQQEVVVKPFEGFMSGVSGLSGATVRGRGEVVNILDVNTL